MLDFNSILDRAKTKGPKRLVVAVAEDDDVLKAVKHAEEENLITAVLVGDEQKIKQVAREIKFDLSKSKIVNETDKEKACLIAVSLVSSGEGDIVMKGLVDTSYVLKAVLNKEVGLRSGNTLSHISVFKLEKYNKMLMITDAGMNIAPTLEEKKQIIENAVAFAHAIEIKNPKVAVICAKEKVNPKMRHTLEAKELEEMNLRGEIKGCNVGGPFALDNAISKEAAKQKGINHPVAGYADILLMPNIEAANALYKALTFLANSTSAALVLGATAPLVVTSRADNEISKLNSIALGVLQASK